MSVSFAVIHNSSDFATYNCSNLPLFISSHSKGSPNHFNYRYIGTFDNYDEAVKAFFKMLVKPFELRTRETELEMLVNSLETFSCQVIKAWIKNIATFTPGYYHIDNNTLVLALDQMDNPFFSYDDTIHTLVVKLD